MIDKSEIKRVAEECGAYVWKENIEVQATAISYYAAGDAMFSKNQLLAFAQHFYKNGQDEQREEVLAEAMRQGWAMKNEDPFEEAVADIFNAICNASPESDIDQATRTE